MTNSDCGHPLSRRLTQCDVRAEVEDVAVMVSLVDEIDVAASRKAERLRLDGSIGDVFLTGDPLEGLPPPPVLLRACPLIAGPLSRP